MQQVGVQVEESVTSPAQAVEVGLDAAAFVELARAGTELAGEFRCADCGYGAVVQRALPICPMCGGDVWESHRPRPSRFDG